ncbi:MAG: hypothetical protein O3A46_17375 [Candidatus Poribacteria bacterium]|nr:hypothetical protein [Candidatus Poribacteria bacterium]
MTQRAKRWWIVSGVTTLVALVAVAFVVTRKTTAQVQLVTVPGRDTVELTIYNSRDLTFAKEQRNITLRQGDNLIQFSWAGTRIDPTSVQLESVSDPEGVQVKEAILPKNLENAILWRVESATPGAHVVQVSYFIQGLTWRADYMAFVNSQETRVRLTGNFMVSNGSGEDYEGAMSRLVVGDIHLVDQNVLRKLDANRGFDMAKASRAQSGGGIASSESLSEYYMYTIKDENTIDNGWSKKITAFDVENVPVNVVYQYDRGLDAVRRLYTFTNDEAHALGTEPLPSGDVRVFMVDDEGQVSFVGQNRIDFASISEEIKLNLGPELAVSVERNQKDFTKENMSFNDDGDVAFYDTEEEIEVKARNFREEAVTLEIPENIYGQLEMVRSSHKYERKDVNTIQYTLELDPGETEVVTYRVKHLGR